VIRQEGLGRLVLSVLKHGDTIMGLLCVSLGLRAKDRVVCFDLPWVCSDGQKPSMNVYKPLTYLRRATQPCALHGRC
jgi:hypothetical protein